MSMMQYVKPLTFWGAIIAIVVGFLEIAFYGLSLIPFSLLGPFWIYAAASVIGYIVFSIIAIICGFLVWRRYFPMLDEDPKGIAIYLVILGILSWVAIGGILIFIAGIIIFLEKEAKA
ncbi:MAG: hypothetical protein ACFE89_09585 [Candidatus Hodarchaeota archaeon]